MATTEKHQTTDRIERRYELRAPRARVWRAITDANQFSAWFGVKLDGAFAPRGAGRQHTQMNWEETKMATIAPRTPGRVRMRPILGVAGMTVLVAVLVLSLSAGAHVPGRHPRGAPVHLEPLPRDLEIQLALSALPPHLRDKATVYVLNPARGFEVARTGTGGFHALVARTGDDTFRGSWPLTAYRDDILYPVSFDEAGAKAQLQVFLDAAEMQARGTPPNELKRIIQERHRTGYYKAPARAGISYMLSPVLRTYFSPEVSDSVLTANIPHVMYYAPDVGDEDIGSGALGGMYPFVILHGHHGYMIQTLGVTERAAITREYRAMLARLCRIKDLWCLPQATREGTSP